MADEWGRYLSRRDYSGLKTASQELVKRCGGIKDVIQLQLTRAGKNGHSLGKQIAPNDFERFMSIDQIADLEAAHGDPLVTRKLAYLSDHALIPIKPVTGTDLVGVHIGRSMKSMGETLIEAAEAISDGKIEPHEADALRKKVHGAVTELAALLGVLKTIEDVR